MEFSLHGNGMELNSHNFLHSYLDGTRKRPNPSGLSQLSVLHSKGSTNSSVTTSTSTDVSNSSSANSSSGRGSFVSSLKRSKRTINLAGLDGEGEEESVSYSGELRMRPMALDLAAMVSQPPAGCDPDVLDYEASGLFISSDEVSLAGDSEDWVSESRSKNNSFCNGSGNNNSNNNSNNNNDISSNDDFYPPSKIRRNGTGLDHSGLDSWTGLQRVLETTEDGRRRSGGGLLSASLPAHFHLGDYSATFNSHLVSNHSSYSHSRSGQQFHRITGSNNSSSSNSSGGSYSYKHPRKLATLGKTPAARMLTTAASAAATAAVQSHQHASVASILVVQHTNTSTTANNSNSSQNNVTTCCNNNNSLSMLRSDDFREAADDGFFL